MASSKSKHHEPLDAIAEIESKGEQILEWATENAKLVLGVAGACLVAAGIYQYTQSVAENRASEASTALEATRSEYLAAMGAAPGALTAPELANPAAGERVRDEYRDRFAAVATEHAGTAGGALASLAEKPRKVGRFRYTPRPSRAESPATMRKRRRSLCGQ